MTIHLPQVSRRTLFQAVGLAGVGFAVGCAQPGTSAGKALGAVFNPFVRVAKDNSITVLIKHIEFGQGVSTGLTTIIAEEMDADWSQMRFEHAPADADKYYNLAFGDKFKVQGTGGSTATANSWMQHRQAGAAARAMLVEAAAKAWGVPAAEVTVEKGVLRHAASNKSAPFGEFAEAAAKIAPPQEPKLKDPKDFTLIGRNDKLPRLDGAKKVAGQEGFTQSFTRPGMLTALVARPPKFGATLKSVDDKAARAVPGVVDVVQIPRGVAVVANGFWAAKKGRDALKVEWDFAKAETRSSAKLFEEFKALSKTPGIPVVKTGSGAPAGGQVIRASYEFPYLSHAPMETLGAVAEFKPGQSLEIWGGCQFPTADQGNAAAIAKLKPEQVKVNILVSGGSFGRRANPESDFVSEAVSIAVAMNGKAPIKVLWTREDDIQGGKYRPMVVHDVAATLGSGGRITSWTHRVVGQPILLGTPFAPPGVKFDFATIGGIVYPAKEGLAPRYAIENMTLEAHHPEVGVPVLWWRSVEHTHTAYVMETMMDELARAARQDPILFRKALLKGQERHYKLLELLMNYAGPAPTGAGRGRGVAIHESFDSVVAQIADVTVSGGAVSVDRIVCAVDCGVAINPDMVRAQMEGGIGYGLSAILGEEIQLVDGAPQPSNFTDYKVLRMDQMPKSIEVYIQPSANPPTGVGEPGTPPVGPAVANAVFAATGRRIRKLPFGAQLA